MRAHLLDRGQQFCAEWTPRIEEKLGRLLRADERERLHALASLFGEFRSSFGRLSPRQVERHGFVVSARAISPETSLAFVEGWHPHDPPADPWALWQHLAYDYEQSGEPVPDVFRPMTDTAPLRVQREEVALRRELDVWRLALSPARPAAAALAASGVDRVVDVRLRLATAGAFWLETRNGLQKPWNAPATPWLTALTEVAPDAFSRLPPPAAALLMVLAAERRRLGVKLVAGQPLPGELAGQIIAYPPARAAVVSPDERPLVIEPESLTLHAVPSETRRDRLDLRLQMPDGRTVADALLITPEPQALYLCTGRVFRGPAPVPNLQLPVAALADASLRSALRALDLRLPRGLGVDVREVELRPSLRCWLEGGGAHQAEPERFYAQLFAESENPPARRQWTGHGWRWTAGGEPPAPRVGDPVFDYTLTAAEHVVSHVAEFDLTWNASAGRWGRVPGKNFVAEFLAWRAGLPSSVEVHVQGELASLFAPALQGALELSAVPCEASGHDWFDVDVKLKLADTRLSPAEIALLLQAGGKWVRLPAGGWRRLELTDPRGTAALVERLGFEPGALLAAAGRGTARLHALQLASELTALEAHDAALAERLRQRLDVLASVPAPGLPPGLRGELRAYQRTGYEFLARLSSQGFGGVLADEMGLGKTVQALAWLLHLADTARAAGRSWRALVVCPKSVIHGWQTEAARVAPGLNVVVFGPAATGGAEGGRACGPPTLLLGHYAQLRSHATWFHAQRWDAAVLDEAQFIKNPLSQVSRAARALPAARRLALTGTPVENRLLDLWSVFAFAQPGLLGGQMAFKRHYPQGDADAAARLRRRLRPFLLRRTKAQVATELPTKTESTWVVELEGPQRRLYDAELKRARAELRGLDPHQAIERWRFNVLASLLRLRQICCHPGLVDPAHRGLPSAKLEALLERLEELRDEGHQVLVFSQFVGMLEIIEQRLIAAAIGYLLLTGATENRGALVDAFQRDPSRTVFLLSTKAAGFGLNLTAASFVIIYDPWWNPAVEAQAIDRTHRLGQTQPVTAYRLISANTLEEKIRALHGEKAALADVVIAEDLPDTPPDLESLRALLA